MAGTSIHPQRGPQTTSAITAQIERWRENVIDLDTAVDDKRVAVVRAVNELREAVTERDRAAVHLQHLIDQALGAAAPQPAA